MKLRHSRVAALMVVGLAVAALAAASVFAAGGDESPREGCTGGASSITATLDDDGRWIETPPQTSGCIPGS